MFIFNLKLNGNKTSKIFIGLLCVISLFITFFICYKLIFNNSLKNYDDNYNKNSITEITSNNYTNVLKTVHKNLDTYVGQKIKISGYIYRIYDFSEEQFVIARNMIISSDFKTVVVGFLCHYNLAKNYEDGTWVELIRNYN